MNVIAEGLRRAAIRAMKKPIPRVPPKVVSPLKQFGSLWVETVELLDPDDGKTQQYDAVYMQHRTVKGKAELRLARIRLHGGQDLPSGAPPDVSDVPDANGKSTIKLLVTLNGEEGSVSIDQVLLSEREPFTISHAYNVVSGRSMGDVIKCIESVALKSQGRTP